MIHEANDIQKKADVAIFTSDKADFKARKVTRQRRSFYNKENNYNSPRKHLLMICTQPRNAKIYKITITISKERTENITVIIEDLNPSLTPMDRSSR